MASATATATMAAVAGFDKAASAASSLQTPASGTFPSEMLSPTAGSPGSMKEALRTPITPPSAYLDFLKTYSPDVRSPMSATSTRFTFTDKTFDKSLDKAFDTSAPRSIIGSAPTSQPPLSRNISSESASSTTTEQSNSTSRTNTSNGSSNIRPESPRIAIPPSPFNRPVPRSARTPRRLHIPQSPFSPALGSAQTVPSPYSSTPLSAAPWSATFSPRDSSDAVNQPGKVHVRHVVTRTVTYCRTPLGPAPRGKRRKIEETTSETGSEKSSSEEPSIKQERIESIEELSEASSREDSASEA